MKEFFQVFMSILGTNLVNVIKGAAAMLLHPKSPFYPICTALEALKSGICTVVQTEWIPNGVNIKCGNDKKCSWWGFNDRELTLEEKKEGFHETPGKTIENAAVENDAFDDEVDFSGFRRRI